MNAETLKTILALTLPFIQNLVQSTIVPVVKRKAYQTFDDEANRVIEDLAENAGKIKDEENSVKKSAYIDGTKLGVETLRAVAEKLNKAADEIERAIN